MSGDAGAAITTLAHVGVPVEGRIVELVGPYVSFDAARALPDFSRIREPASENLPLRYASVPLDARDDGANGTYVPWRAHECPSCHALGR